MVSGVLHIVVNISVVISSHCTMSWMAGMRNTSRFQNEQQRWTEPNGGFRVHFDSFLSSLGFILGLESLKQLQQYYDRQPYCTLALYTTMHPLVSSDDALRRKQS